MNITDQINAAGIVPPLRNLDAESLAQNIAANIHNPEERQRLFKEHYDSHPNLKQWESQAIRNRTFCIAKEKLK